MRIDVSELKTRKECGRKWLFSSRNAFHMRPTATRPNLVFGTLFHECLHAMYGNPNIDLDKLLEKAMHELAGDTTAQKNLNTMLRGYYDTVLPMDRDRFEILTIEHQFRIPLWALGTVETADVDEFGEPCGTFTTEPAVEVCGSIDMVVLEKATNKVWGIEHKTCKNFRTDVYNIMDEQPKMYNLALQQYVDDHNDASSDVWSVGGIIINEVRKLSTKFEYSRRDCVYTAASRDRFLQSLYFWCGQILQDSQTSSEDDAIEAAPSYMKCQMCDYATICEHIGDGKTHLDDIMEEFAEEFEVRKMDHLDEKSTRKFDEDAE